MFDGQEKISADDLAVLTDTVCTGTGKGGGFDKLVSLTGDFWTTHDTYYSNIMSEESINSPIDLNILIIEPEECGSHGSAGEVLGVILDGQDILVPFILLKLLIHLTTLLLVKSIISIFY